MLVASLEAHQGDIEVSLLWSGSMGLLALLMGSVLEVIG